MKPVLARLLVGLTLLLSGALGQTVSAVAMITSVTLNPSTVAGGSGGTSTATVMLSEPAPAGGSVLTMDTARELVEQQDGGCDSARECDGEGRL
jgi:hypothetical protein